MPLVAWLFKHRRHNGSHARAGKTKRSTWPQCPPLDATEPGALVDMNPALKSIPLVSQSSRASSPDVPDLPCLPIYECFAPGNNQWTMADKKPDAVSRLGPRDHTPVQPAVVPELDGIKHSRPSMMQPLTEATVEAPPAYDRAAELGQYYRSMLPDRETMGYEDDSYSSRNHQSAAAGHPHPQSRRRQTFPPSLPADVQMGRVREPMRCESPRPHRGPQPSSTRDSPGITITEEHHSTTTQYRHSLSTCSAQPRRPRHDSWPLPAPPSSSRKEPCRQSSDCSGLQICTELLTDELAKVFCLQRQGAAARGEILRVGRRVSKLQVLLMIEAYEAMLEGCRWEMAAPHARSDGGKEGERASSHMRDAVEILKHWLDSLYGIYDEAFGGG
ncbi:hypothetical protein VTK56DRAFT_4859 [Thermocarpiscus australiensis]